jgi:hypothetical protein
VLQAAVNPAVVRQLEDLELRIKSRGRAVTARDGPPSLQTTGP